MNTRLQQFLSAENITQSEFADTLGVARAGISHIISGRNKPGFEFISSLMLHYPRLNMDWLINGQGKMYKENKTSDISPKTADLFSRDEQQTATESTLFAAEKPQDSPKISHPSQQEESVIEVKRERIPEDSPSPILQTVETPSVTTQRKACKVVIFYDDGTYQEMPV